MGIAFSLHNKIELARRGGFALRIGRRPASIDPGTFAITRAGDLLQRIQQCVDGVCRAGPGTARKHRASRRLGGGET